MLNIFKIVVELMHLKFHTVKFACFFKAEKKFFWWICKKLVFN